MYTAEYKGINAFLIGVSKLLYKEGVPRNIKGKICYELPEPCCFKIEDPSCRMVTIQERRWNKILPYAESLWLASGRNNLEMIGHYLSKMAGFSDDGMFLRGGYGPRLRHYNGNMSDYKIDSLLPRVENIEIDQFKYIVDCFNRNPETRQAVIMLGDPMKDCFEENYQLKQTKDIPCTRMLHFMKDARSNRLNLYVTMRSNDLIWGASAVNIFNYTFMLEYFSAILNMEMGSYFHIVNNMHYYDYHKAMIENIAKLGNIEESPVKYKKTFHSLDEFDNLLNMLAKEELLMIKNPHEYKPYKFEDEFFNHWYQMFYDYNIKKVHKINI